MIARNWRRWLLVVVFIGIVAAMIAPGGIISRTVTREAGAAVEKIEPSLLDELNREGQTDFFIWMAEKADLSPAHALHTKEAKGQFVFDTLVATAERTQQGVRTYLDREGIPYQSFYIANKIYVEQGSLDAVMALAKRNDVAQVTANREYQMERPEFSDAPVAAESNLTFVKADDVWALGYTGDGTVLAGNDTGIQWNHPALINQYRGWNGSSADHNYNWWDATGTYPTVPGDGFGHGTHTTGTMVGDDGGSNQVGMAPTAQMIHCKNMTDGGSGSDVTFTTCFEWDLAPWDLSGNNPQPALAPDAITNSWGYWGGNAPQFEDEITALRAAGIVVEVSAGNEGPGCATLRSPGDYRNSLVTGSVNHAGGVLPGTITGFSSRGPSDLYGADFMPDIMAPGQNIRSSVPGNGYSSSSGTSMSGPHVTGLIGLMWSASPGLRGNVVETEQIIMDTAIPLTGQTGSNCGGDYSEGPNNDWGHGTIDALAAVEAAIIAGGPYRLEVEPETTHACVADDAYYAVHVLLNDESFTDPVDLDALGTPAGITADFAPDNQPAPYTSTLTLGNTAAATAGNYSIDIVGTAPGQAQTTTVGLVLHEDLPGAVSLISPADGATDVAPVPAFVWTEDAQATGYTLEIAVDPDFNHILHSESTTAISTTLDAALPVDTALFWRVTAENPCGPGNHSPVYSLHTADAPSILLVDDDDNSPDVQGTYTFILDALGVDYDVWDTDGQDANEPAALDMAPYQTVIWFTGDGSGTQTGPGEDGEAALGEYLNANKCLLLSSQDYYSQRGLTPFMQDYLGAAAVTDDVAQTSVTGTGVFAGVGPYNLSYFFANHSDDVTPDGTAAAAFNGSTGTAAISKEDGYRATFFGFPFEAIPSTVNRLEALSGVLDWCSELRGLTVDGEQAQEGVAGTQVTYVMTVTNNGAAADNYLMTLDSVWEASLSTFETGMIDPGESVMVALTVDIPAGASAGDMADTALTLRSLTASSVVQSVTVTTTVIEAEPFTYIYIPMILNNP